MTTPELPAGTDGAFGVLSAISNFLNAPGEPMAGCEIPLNELARITAERFPHKPYCLVEKWIFADLDVTEEEAAILRSHGQEPNLLYSHRVIDDSAGRFHPGNWVRSTGLVKFTDGIYFETRNTVYVLVGAGQRKKVRPQIILSIV